MGNLAPTHWVTGSSSILGCELATTITTPASATLASELVSSHTEHSGASLTSSLMEYTISAGIRLWYGEAPRRLPLFIPLPFLGLRRSLSIPGVLEIRQLWIFEETDARWLLAFRLYAYISAVLGAVRSSIRRSGHVGAAIIGYVVASTALFPFSDVELRSLTLRLCVPTSDSQTVPALTRCRHYTPFQHGIRSDDPGSCMGITIIVYVAATTLDDVDLAAQRLELSNALIWLARSCLGAGAHDRCSCVSTLSSQPQLLELLSARMQSHGPRCTILPGIDRKPSTAFCRDPRAVHQDFATDVLHTTSLTRHLDGLGATRAASQDFRPDCCRSAASSVPAHAVRATRDDVALLTLGAMGNIRGCYIIYLQYTGLVYTQYISNIPRISSQYTGPGYSPYIS
ncbi:hypothetical protein B0H15DRAFT_966163 [Mycena belliarum]|uniref:Uncharacterized protein n=1 Tax=Mycena belliarum TaxID=1033014 RepID=A0AAD6TNE5_9AGAR|nr:hypothetical protein B0H15DRAFT_966163 [Mycena belliae]